MGIYDPRTERWRKRSKFAITGIPDIQGVYLCVNPVVFFMEVKSEDGVASKSQIAFINKMTKMKVPVTIVRKLQEAQCFFQEKVVNYGFHASE